MKQPLLAVLPIVLLISGCKPKSTSNEPPKMLFTSLVQYQYVRQGTNVPIIYFLHSTHADGTLMPEGDFTPAELALMINSLERVSDDLLAKSGVRQVIPVLGQENSVRRVESLIYITFTEPNSRRALDPDLGTELLKAALSDYTLPGGPGGGDPPDQPHSSINALKAGRSVTSLKEKILVTSPNLPPTYTTLLSPEGFQAIQEEAHSVSQNRSEDPTQQDLIRPHGSFIVH